MTAKSERTSATHAGGMALCALLAGLLPAAAQGTTPADRPAEAAPQTTPAEAPRAEPPGTRYHGERDVQGLFSGWLGTGLCEELELPPSRGGRPIHGVQLGGWGQTPLAARTTVLLVGGLDGVSLSGSEAVVRAVDALLAAPDRLPADVTFVALPWANPDGLARAREGKGLDGRNGLPLDEDRDGAVDEDGPDDLDGDGAILELLVEDPAGPWVRCADGRFLRRALSGEAPRYRRGPEGRDDDGDGRYNEDGPGGVLPERNFPLGWRGPLADPAAGPWPLSEPCTRALADLALSRRVAVALLFEGNHGGLMPPAQLAAGQGGEPEGLALDQSAYGRLRSLFEERTGRSAVPVGPGRRAPSGRAIEWLHGALGVLAVEVACWGPEVEGAEATPRFVPGGWRAEELSGAAELSEAELCWARWLDDLRGGLGFVEWQPVDLGDGRQGLLGGWEPRTCANPPPELLSEALGGIDRFVPAVAAALPRLELERVESRRDGTLCTLRARLRNTGGLASGLGSTGEAGRVRLSLELPEGVELVAGEREHVLAPIPGGGTSRELAWLVVAPEGSVFTFRVVAPWSAPLTREVRL